MRLITWNCNLSLARKLDLLLQLEPDIAVIQECEESLIVPDGYLFSWRGNNPKKGLGVLSKKQKVIVSPLMQDQWIYFLPLTFPETGLRLLALWAYNHRASRFGLDKIGYPLEILSSLSEWLSEGKAIVVGDFNNSIIWDKPKAALNFSAIDNKLRSLGFRSAYHAYTGEKLGTETRSSYFHTKSLEKTFHIDYCYVHNSLKIKSVILPDYAHWRAASDHIPVIVEVYEE